MRGARRASRQKGAASQTPLGLAEPLGFFTAAVRVSVSSGRRRRATTAVGTFNHHQDLTVRLYRSAEPDPQPQTPSISWVARGLAPGPPGRARPRAASGARPPARSATASSRTTSPSRSPPSAPTPPTPPTAPSRAAPRRAARRRRRAATSCAAPAAAPRAARRALRRRVLLAFLEQRMSSLWPRVLATTDGFDERHRSTTAATTSECRAGGGGPRRRRRRPRAARRTGAGRRPRRRRPPPAPRRRRAARGLGGHRRARASDVVLERHLHLVGVRRHPLAPSRQTTTAPTTPTPAGARPRRSPPEPRRPAPRQRVSRIDRRLQQQLRRRQNAAGTAPRRADARGDGGGGRERLELGGAQRAERDGETRRPVRREMGGGRRGSS